RATPGRSWQSASRPRSRPPAEPAAEAMARVLVLSFSDQAQDPRVHRQLQALAGSHELVAAGFGAPLLDVEFVDLRPPPSEVGARTSQAAGLGRMLTRRFDAAYWGNRVVRHALSRLEELRLDAV